MDRLLDDVKRKAKGITIEEAKRRGFRLGMIEKKLYSASFLLLFDKLPFLKLFIKKKQIEKASEYINNAEKDLQNGVLIAERNDSLAGYTYHTTCGKSARILYLVTETDQGRIIRGRTSIGYCPHCNELGLEDGEFPYNSFSH